MKHLIFFALATLLFSCSSKKDVVTVTEPEVSKQITFKLKNQNDYSSPSYDSVYTKIELIITKESRTDFSQTVLFDTMFVDRRIIEYKSLLPYTVVKKIDKILDSRDLIKAKYIIITQNHMPFMGGATVSGGSIPIPTGSQFFEVEVTL